MSYVKSFLLPRIGESLDSARVVSWVVEPGQLFSEGDIILEIETDKSIVEIPATEAGKLVDQLVARGGLLDADKPVARIEVEGEAPSDAAADSQALKNPIPQAVEIAATPVQPTPPILAPQVAPSPGQSFFSTPAARFEAQRSSVDISALIGSGPDGRVTLNDVINATKQMLAAPGDLEPRRIDTTYGAVQAFFRKGSSLNNAKPTLIFLHGLFGSTDGWASVIASVARAGFDVVAIDLPCHGQSPACVANFSELVDAAEQAVNALCSTPMALIGHSMGAAVATRLARRLGPRLASLTIFAPAGLGTEINQSFIDGMLHARTDDAFSREISKLTSAGALPSAAFIRALRQQLEARHEALTTLCQDLSCQGVQQINIIPDLAALSCPTAIIHGRDDAIIPWQHALNAPARVALHLAPQTGHMPYAEALTLACEVIEKSARL